MESAGIERTLQNCEDALAQGGKVNLAKLGFWKAVSVVKRTPGAVQRYGDRIAAIDREAFVRSAPIVMPAWTGVGIEAFGTAVSVAILAIAPALASPSREVAYLVGAGGLIGATHALTHYFVGSLMGIRFTHFYSRPPLSPQPGFKTDYATYLRAPARSRAWMHASGAIVSKAIPFIVAATAWGTGAALWAVGVLVALGLLTVVTDLTLSTKTSDWKKFRREMRFAS